MIEPERRIRIRQLAILSAVLIATAFGQIPTATLVGTVTDPSGAVLPGATVTLVDVGTGYTRNTTTSSSGSFEFPALRPTDYEISAEASGFRKSVAHATVAVGEIGRVDFKLQVGNTSEVVQVQGEIPLVEPDRTSIATTVDPNQIKSLPMLGRNVLNLALTVPGTLDQAPGTQAGGLSVAGMRAQSNNFTLDGTSLNDPQVNGPLILFSLTDAIQEFNVQTSIATADVGRNPGAQVSFITKAGTNSYHGTLFEYARNDAFDANNYFLNRAGQKRNELRRHQFGGTMGGYLRKDKTFWFGSIEAIRQINPLPQTARVPTDAERAAVTDPTSQKLLAFIPHANTALVGGKNWAGSVPQKTNSETYLLRIDQNLTNNHRMMGRGTVVLGRSLTLQQNPFNGSITNWPSSHNYVINDVYNTSKWLNEFRAGFTRNRTFFRAGDVGVNPASIFTDSAGNPLPGYVDTRIDPLDGGLPRITVSGFSNFGLGAGTNMPQGRSTNTFELIDNVSYATGRHRFQFGGEAKREDTHRFLNGNFRGAISFASFLPPATGVDNSFASGKPRSGSLRTGGSDGSQTFRDWWKYADYFFVQDTYKAKDNLTINLGLRYEYPGAMKEKKNRGSNFVPGVGMVALNSNQVITIDPTKQGRAAIVLTPGPVFLPASGELDTPKTHFSPAVGISYSPSSSWGLIGEHKTVIRTGFRLGFDEVFANIPVNMGLNGPQVLTTTLPTGQYSWATALSQNRFLFSADPTFAGGQRGIVTFNAWDTHGNRAYAMNYALELEREIGQNFVFGANYIGSQGRKLGMFIDVNEPFVTAVDPTRRGDQTPNTRTFPFQQYGAVANGTFPGSSNYNSLVTSFRARPWHGVSGDISYTYGHSLDENSSFFGSDRDFGSPADVRNLRAEYGRSDFDVRQRLVGSYTFDLPFGRTKWIGTDANAVVDRIIGGWQIAGITTWRTGFPFTVWGDLNTTDFSGFNQFADRGDLIAPGSAFDLSQGDPDHAFNPALFLKPRGALDIGNTRRNEFTGARYFNQDFAILKNFRITESKTFQLRAELFNAFNMTRFKLPSSTISSSAFGTYTSAEDPRIVQLAGRIEW